MLIHELSHAIRSYTGKDNKIHYLADKNAKISAELWEKVKKHYADQNVEVNRMDLYLDEASAYYAEEILGTDAALDLLLGKKKTLKEKILSFFRGAIKRYAGDEALTREARKFYRSFKKMFDAFAAKNQMAEANNQLAEAKSQLAEVKDQIAEVKDQIAEAKDQLADVKERSADIRAAVEEGDSNAKSTAYVKAENEVNAENLIDYIAAHSDLDYRFGDHVSPKFEQAVKKYGNLAHSRLYRGMDASELDFIIENGYIKSNSSYNFSHQQGQTRLSPQIKTAYAYATHFAPEAIRKRFFEEGMPSYIVEVGNFEELGIVNEDNIESYTKKEIDKKYITRIIELTYDSKTESIKARDISIDGMNKAKGKIHGVPEFVQDKVTGTILFKHQDENGKEDGKYISEKNPDMIFDYRMVKEFEGKDFDFNDYVGVSGNESDLEPFTFPKKTFDSGIESSEGKMYNNGDLFTATQEFYNKVPYAKRSDFARSLANKTVDIKDGVQYIYVTGYIFEATGYMQGHIIAPYNNNTKKLLEANKNEYADIQSSKAIAPLWSKTVRYAGGRSSGNSDVSKRIQSTSDDRILGIDSGSSISRDNESLRKVAEGAGENLKNKRYAIDDSYLSAVERGDMVTAQRMVDEAADKAMPNSILREGDAINKGEEAEGTLIKMFHGSGAKGFYTFTPQDGALGKGVYVTSNWDEAVGYAIDKLGIAENDAGYYEWNGEEYDGIGSIGEALESDGYVRSFYANVTDSNDVSSSSVYWEDVIALVRDPAQIKSADPVTYDDDGKVIPLSERFNAKNPDIRYAVEEATESPTIGNVAKSRFDEPKPKLKEKIKAGFTSAKDKLYIEGVDELYGVEKYLKKFGGRKDAEAFVQQVRASETIAQTMIGLSQYDIMSGDGTRLGDGI